VGLTPRPLLATRKGSAGDFAVEPEPARLAQVSASATIDPLVETTPKALRDLTDGGVPLILETSKTGIADALGAGKGVAVFDAM
jgi:hypothetical protein